MFLKKFTVTLKKVAYEKYHHGKDFIEKLDEEMIEELTNR